MNELCLLAATIGSSGMCAAGEWLECCGCICMLAVVHDLLWLCSVYCACCHSLSRC